MKTDKHFISEIREVGQFAQTVNNNSIKKEPMFFNSDLNFAYSNGGAITQSFINALPDDWKTNVVFDSRVHMLMPGWYPAIPGFHHDDVPRPEIPVGQHFITAGQPDYDAPAYFSQHILGLVNAEICPTEFAIGECIMPKAEWGELIYRKWDAEVKRLIDTGNLKSVNAKDRTLTMFDCATFHSGQKAKAHGWRWFGRVSRNTDRVNKITNEIRQQAQVYLEFPMEGW